MKSTFFNISKLSLLMALLCFQFAFAETGAELVKIQEPDLYASFVIYAGGESKADDFFRYWTKKDIENYYRKKASGLHRWTDPSLPLVPTTPNLFAQFNGKLLEITGELYALKRIQREARKTPGTIVLNELEYSDLNPNGSKPDAIIYRIDGNYLNLDGIGEAKLNVNGYDRKQAEKYLDYWKENGMTVRLKDGSSKWFPANKIRIQVKGKPKLLSRANQKRFRDLEKITILYTTSQVSGFKGTEHKLNVSVDALRDAFSIYISKLRKNRPPLRGANRRHFSEPNTQEEVHHFKVSLNNWLMENGRFPRQSDNPMGWYLAKSIKAMGGQSEVYIEFADGDTKKYLVSHGKIPSIGSLERAIERRTPSDKGAIEALENYLYIYGDKALPLLDRLKSKSGAWQNYLNPFNMKRLQKYINSPQQPAGGECPYRLLGKKAA